MPSIAKTEKINIKLYDPDNKKDYYDKDNHFFKSVKIGQIGEKHVANHVDELAWISQNEETVADFRVIKTGELVELKTEYGYTTKSTPNFFLERFRNLKGQPGGPWYSHINSVRWFMKLFADGHLFIFETKELIDRVDFLINKNNLKEVFIRGEHRDTIGYLIKRSDLRDIYKKVELPPLTFN